MVEENRVQEQLLGTPQAAPAPDLLGQVAEAGIPLEVTGVPSEAKAPLNYEQEYRKLLEEHRKMQGAKDRQLFEMERQLQEVQQSVASMGMATQNQQMMQWAKEQIDKGADPEAVRAQVQAVQRAQMAEAQAQGHAMQVLQQQAFLLQQAKPLAIEDIARKHGVEVADLQECTTASEAVRLAKAIQRAKASLKPPMQVDTGVSGGGMSDKAFLEAYASGRSNDHARARKLLGQ